MVYSRKKGSPFFSETSERPKDFKQNGTKVFQKSHKSSICGKEVLSGDSEVQRKVAVRETLLERKGHFRGSFYIRLFMLIRKFRWDLESELTSFFMKHYLRISKCRFCGWKIRASRHLFAK